MTLILICALLLGGSIPAAPGPEEAAIVTFADGATVTCEISDSPQKRSIGLSEHASLAPDHGMLFIYPGMRETSFWMPPQMKFSIDIIFLDESRRVVHIAPDAPPCPDPKGYNCPSYSPEQAVMYVLEVPAGTAKRHGLENGVVLKIDLPAGYRMPEY